MPRHSLKRSWTEDETRRLREHIEQGGSAARAASKFRRSENAVCDYANSIGLKFPTIRDLRTKASGSPRYMEDPKEPSGK